ncbi:MAG TPA: FecR domain-containing protein [Steroidobacteraceae bacterium]
MAAAAQWHTRLDEDEVDPTVYAEFDAWLAVDTRHRDAYRAVDEMWARMSEARADPRILDLRREALNATRDRSRWPRILALGVGFSGSRAIPHLVTAIVALLVCGAIVVGYLKLREPAGEGSALLAESNRMEGGAFRTAIGERSTVTMSDGSTIVLNTNTRVDIDFTPRARHVRLLGGQVWFQVARNPGRPFIVDAGEQRVTALGTAFDVQLAENRDTVQVTLVEGRVSVESIQSGLASLLGSHRKPAVLAPGESLIAMGHEPAARRKADVSKIDAWRRGQVVFDGDTLNDAVVEINRYSRTQIELADPTLASLSVSGVFTVGHSESFIETVIGHYPIRIAERNAERVVLVGRPQ